MTREREEAINYLKNSMAIGEDDGSRYHNEILEFTIKELEQETVPREHYEHEFFLRKELDFKVARLENQIAEQESCEDAVSRQQALKELKESAEHHANDSREEALLRRDRDIIRALPPVTPAQKWIPTSERQPKENGNYLALYRTSDGTASLEFMMVDHCNAGGGWLHEEKGRKAYKKVIAWMPLPAEPHKVEMESEE